MGEAGRPDGEDAPGGGAAREGPRRRWPLVGAGAAVVVLLVAVGAFLLGSDDDAFCEALSEPAGDVGRFSQLVVFLENDATDAQIDHVEDVLVDALGITDLEFVDEQQAYDEFVELFGDNTEMVEAVAPGLLPTSFRGVPPTELLEPPSELDGAPGVYRVVMPSVVPEPRAVDVIDYAFSTRPAEVPGAFESTLWRVGGNIHLFDSIDLDAAIDDVDDDLAADLRTIDEGMDAIARGEEPDSAVISATDRVLVQYGAQCDNS